MMEQTRQQGDIIHLLDFRPERRYLITGILTSLILHGGWIGKAAYDAWRGVQQWRDLLSIEVVDEPGRSLGRRRLSMIELTRPLYYPPGLVSPLPGTTTQPPKPAADRRRPSPRTETEDAERLQEQQQETVTSGEATDGQVAADQSQILQEQIQRFQQQARTLNIGPLREQIANIYKAQQEGQLTIGEISVAVNFKVREDGAFTHVRLIESSGITEIDNAALLVVDELNKLRALAPLQKTDSVTLRLSIAQEVVLRTIVAASSEAEAARQVRHLNDLLAALRLLSTAQKRTQTVHFLSKIVITQEGSNIVTVARIDRAEASQLLKRQLGSGSE
ncbi:MAG: hypothetical protein RMM98_08620 [Acidobacteriota bacterium]|nr:hypothetical protein [Blastocatellia bacterium]MDW8239666.1 hypothetical protein [Acidobacteriota bacterium]